LNQYLNPNVINWRIEIYDSISGQVNKTLEEKVQPDSEFEEGIYFCKLKFADNSEINFQIVK
jgi:hypothetical protein